MENPFSDFGILSSYSRKEAIEDGTLIDLTTNFPAICGQLYQFPIACTAAVWGVIEKAVENKRHCNDYAGVVWDVLWMSRKGIVQHIDDSQHLFTVIVTGAGRSNYHTFKIVCHPGDEAEPVITIMMPEED